MTAAGRAARLYDCVIAALEKGMRKNEILSLQWRHVRWLQNELAIERLMDQDSASWNRAARWLRLIAGLRTAA